MSINDAAKSEIGGRRVFVKSRTVASGAGELPADNDCPRDECKCGCGRPAVPGWRWASYQCMPLKNRAEIMHACFQD